MNEQVPRLPVLDRRHHRPMRHLIASELYLVFVDVAKTCHRLVKEIERK
jgi:hypothetical protein